MKINVEETKVMRINDSGNMIIIITEECIYTWEQVEQ